MAVWGTKTSLAYTRDHTVADAPVLPVVLALEWFTRRAQELFPDRQVAVNLPDIVGRRQILAVHAKKVKLAEDVDLGTRQQAEAGAGIGD